MDHHRRRKRRSSPSSMSLAACGSGQWRRMVVAGSVSAIVSSKFTHCISSCESIVPAIAYLIFHDCLLESWPDHGLRPRLLAPAPDIRSVRRLHDALLLGVKWIFYQRLIFSAHRDRRERIGAGGRRVSLLRIGVVGGDRVVGLGAV